MRRLMGIDRLIYRIKVHKWNKARKSDTADFEFWQIINEVSPNEQINFKNERIF